MVEKFAWNSDDAIRNSERVKCAEDDFVEGEILTASTPETFGELAECWTVLLDQVSRCVGSYPDCFYEAAVTLIHLTEQMAEPDSFEQDVIRTASKLADDGKLKVALFKLHEVIEARLEGR